MNIERLKELAEAIRDPKIIPDHEFDMEVGLSGAGALYGPHECGTVGCIAGTCVLMFSELAADLPQYGRVRWSLVTDEAQALLELTAKQADELFEPMNCGIPSSWYDSREKVTKVIEHLIQTGEVDWSINK